MTEYPCNIVRSALPRLEAALKDSADWPPLVRLEACETLGLLIEHLWDLANEKLRTGVENRAFIALLKDILLCVSLFADQDVALANAPPEEESGKVPLLPPPRWGHRLSRLVGFRDTIEAAHDGAKRLLERFDRPFPPIDWSRLPPPIDTEKEKYYTIAEVLGISEEELQKRDEKRRRTVRDLPFAPAKPLEEKGGDDA